MCEIIINYNNLLKYHQGDLNKIQTELDVNDWSLFRPFLYHLEQEILKTNKIFDHNLDILSDVKLQYRKFIFYVPMWIKEYAYYRMCIMDPKILGNNICSYDLKCAFFFWMRNQMHNLNPIVINKIGNSLNYFSSIYNEITRLFIIVGMLATYLQFNDQTIGDIGIKTLIMRIKKEVLDKAKDNEDINIKVISKVFNVFPVKWNSKFDKLYSSTIFNKIGGVDGNIFTEEK